MNRKQKMWIYIAAVGIAAALLLKTVWWPAEEVLGDVANITEALVVETLSGDSRQVYADEEAVGELAELLGDMKLKFDRKSDTFAYDNDVPAYDLMLSGDGFSRGVIFISNTRIHYNDTIYIMNEEDAAALHDLLSGCFS